jgi:hypothetical protein
MDVKTAIRHGDAEASAEEAGLMLLDAGAKVQLRGLFSIRILSYDRQ